MKNFTTKTLLLVLILGIQFFGFCGQDEFLVNTNTNDAQEYPCVAMDAFGNFVITWQSKLADGDGYGIFAQRYDNEANPISSEFQVNAYTTGDQENPAIAMDDAGNFVIVWQSYGQDGSDYGIYAQRFDNTGNVVGSEFQVNTETNYHQMNPAVAMDKTGNFFIAWQSDWQDGSHDGIFGKLYDSNGSRVGLEFQINSYTSSDQMYPAIAMDCVGNFTVTWTSYSQDGSGYGIFAQKFDMYCNTIGLEYQVNTSVLGNQMYPAISLNDNGSFIITWQSSDGSGTGIFAQRYNNLNNKVGYEFQVNTNKAYNQNRSSVAIDNHGNFIISWQSWYQDGEWFGVIAKRFDMHGNPIGREYQINTFYTACNQMSPTIAMDNTGNFIITWTNFTDYYLDSACDIYAKLNPGFDIEEFLVNTYIENQQTQPAVAINDAGNFAITWISSVWLGDEYDHDIKAQVFDNHGNTVGSEIDVNTYTDNKQQYPDIAMDGAGNFVITWECVYEELCNDIFARRYNFQGNPLGDEFLVNNTTYHCQGHPSIAMNNSGNFVITWQGGGAQDGSRDGIFAQMYARDSSPVGNEFQVNTYTADYQATPVIAMTDSGDFIIAWSSQFQDGSGYGIYAQLFDRNGNQVGEEFQVNTYSRSSFHINRQNL